MDYSILSDTLQTKATTHEQLTEQQRQQLDWLADMLLQAAAAQLDAAGEICRTQRLNTIFSISGLLSSSYASIKLETGSENATRPVKGQKPDTNRTQLDIYKADFEAVMNCYLILNAA